MLYKLVADPPPTLLHSMLPKHHQTLCKSSFISAEHKNNYLVVAYPPCGRRQTGLSVLQASVETYEIMTPSFIFLCKPF